MRSEKQQICNKKGDNMFAMAMNITQEIIINKPIQEVYDAISNFNIWKNWSPWLCMEPSAVTKTENHAGVIGHNQSWDGNLIGSGRMTLSQLEPHKKIICDLEFFKPWKSQSQSIFTFSVEGAQTRIKWEMIGHLPFFMIFFKKMMMAYIANDFRRGLSMLKEYLESGVVLSATQIMGTEKKPGFYYVGIKHEAKISDLGRLSKEDFTELGAKVRAGSIAQPAFMLTTYRKFDMVNGNCIFTSALAYKNEVDAQKAMASIDRTKVQSSYIEEHKGFQVMHTGAYEHLGNAWATAMSAQRQHKLKSDKHVDMYEVYVNTPMNASIKDLKTQIIIPVR